MKNYPKKDHRKVFQGKAIEIKIFDKKEQSKHRNTIKKALHHKTLYQRYLKSL